MIDVSKWAKKNREILKLFDTPKTPKQVEKQLGLKKLKMKVFLEKRMLRSLNPEARKGRLYVLTTTARRLLELTSSDNKGQIDWDLVGWIISSPCQRYAVLKTMAVDSVKRFSEEIRKRASKLNPYLSRISTKGILQDLINTGLVYTEIGDDLRRYYWISQKGKKIIDDIGAELGR
jgi:hypothetical protein